MFSQLAKSILGGAQQAQVQKLNLGNPKVQYLNLGESKVQKLNLGTISEDQQNQSDTAKVQNLNLGLTTCSSSLLKTTTTSQNPRARENDFYFPPSLTSAEIALALDQTRTAARWIVRQAFLDETAAQIERKRQTQHPIRNPIGFLDWLCSEYSQGNNRLTSLSVRYQEQRQMQQQIDNTADQSVQTFETELKQPTPKPTANKNNQNQESKKPLGRSEPVSMTIQTLLCSITLILHTHQAQQMIHGRPANPALNQSRISGLLDFARHCTRLWTAASAR